VDFTNTIIVLTSNIGAQYILEEVENPTMKNSDGKLSQIIKDRVMKEVCRILVFVSIDKIFFYLKGSFTFST